MKRYPSLDVLRALAVMLVIGHHASFRFTPNPSDPIAAVFKYSGWIGVDIFFVISGYLITRILIEKQYGLGTFFRRRAYRILPLYFVAILVFVLSALATGIDSSLLGRIWSPALLLNGWTIPIFGYGNVPYTITWSVSVEETAYILLGLSSLVGVFGVTRMIYAMLVVAILVRVGAVASGQIDLTSLYFFVAARLDAIAIGGLVALGCFDRIASGSGSKPLAMVAVFALIWAYRFTPINEPFLPLIGYLIFSCVVAVLICALVRTPHSLGSDVVKPVRILNIWLISFGKYSYFIYLFHIFVLEGLRMILPGVGLPDAGFWTGMALTVIVVHILATVSWKMFEYPLIVRGRRPSGQHLSQTAR